PRDAQGEAEGDGGAQPGAPPRYRHKEENAAKPNRKDADDEIEKSDPLSVVMPACPNAGEQKAALESLAHERRNPVVMMVEHGGRRLEPELFAESPRLPAEGDVAYEPFVPKTADGIVEGARHQEVGCGRAVGRAAGAAGEPFAELC